MTEPLLPPLDLESHQLENGLRVVLHRDHDLPLVAVNLWYHVGSKNERPGHTGFAHLFEHMLFQGSAHVGTNDHFHYVQQVGGVANGSTWFDRTNYYETLPSHELELGLWLESDRMGWLLPAMSAEKLETQRQVVMNERRQSVDNQPYGRAFERLHELLYPLPHPYHWPVIGYMEDIEAATLEEVREFFRTWYAPGNAVLTLAGDLEPAVALESVTRFFGEIPAGPVAPARPEPRADAVEPAVETLPDDVNLARVYIGYRGPAYGQREWYALDLLSTLLTAGRSSPMYLDLVHERQIAQDVGAFVFPTELDATFAVVSTARADTDPHDLRQRLLGHLRTIAERGCSDVDFERARNKVITDHVEGFQQLDQRADLIGCCATYFGDPERAGCELDHSLDLTPEDLRQAARDWLVTRDGATVIVVPNP